MVGGTEGLGIRVPTRVEGDATALELGGTCMMVQPLVMVSAPENPQRRSTPHCIGRMLGMLGLRRRGPRKSWSKEEAGDQPSTG